MSINEHEIISRINEAKNDISVANELIEKYLPFITSVANKATGRFVVLGVDDELGIAMAGFHDAINSYSNLRGSFLKYAELVMKRKIIDFQRKEKRHKVPISLDSSFGGEADEGSALVDTIPDDKNAIDDIDNLSATKNEIAKIIAELSEFDIKLSDVASECPKQKRTVEACRKAALFAKNNKHLISEMKKTKRLPVSALCEGTGIDKKTVERHRKYLISLMIIYSNGFDIIRGHLKEVFLRSEGGEQN